MRQFTDFQTMDVQINTNLAVIAEIVGESVTQSSNQWEMEKLGSMPMAYLAYSYIELKKNLNNTSRASSQALKGERGPS